MDHTMQPNDQVRQQEFTDQFYRAMAILMPALSELEEAVCDGLPYAAAASALARWAGIIIKTVKEPALAAVATKMAEWQLADGRTTGGIDHAALIKAQSARRSEIAGKPLH